MIHQVACDPPHLSGREHRPTLQLSESIPQSPHSARPVGHQRFPPTTNPLPNHFESPSGDDLIMHRESGLSKVTNDGGVQLQRLRSRASQRVSVVHRELVAPIFEIDRGATHIQLRTFQPIDSPVRGLKNRSHRYARPDVAPGLMAEQSPAQWYVLPPYQAVSRTCRNPTSKMYGSMPFRHRVFTEYREPLPALVVRCPRC